MAAMHRYCIAITCIITLALSYRDGDIIGVVSPPFGEVAAQYQNNAQFRSLLRDPENYNPNWGKTGIAFSIIYYIRNARLGIGYMEQRETRSINGETANELWSKVFKWEMDIFTAFRNWYDDSRNDQKWKEFVYVVHGIFDNKLRSLLPHLSSNNAFKSSMHLYKEDGLGPKFLPSINDQRKDLPSDRKFDRINPFIPTADNGFPLIGFGSWPLTGQDCKDSVLLALKTGYRLIDTSENYNNEKVIGEAMRESGIDRKDIMIASKLSHNKNYGEGVTTEAFDETLDNLGVDYIDVYMLHGAIGDKKRLKEAWQELEVLYDQGKIKYLGVSNFGPNDMNQLMEYARIPPSFIQNKYDPFTIGQQTPWTPSIEEWVTDYNRNKEPSEQMLIQGYCALNSWPHQIPAVNDKHIEWIASKYNKTPAQLLIRWVLQHKYMSILTRSSKEERQINNLNVFDFEINDQDMLLLNGLNTLFSPFDIQWMNDVYGQVKNRPNMNAHVEL